MEAVLYAMRISNPSQAALAALRLKRLRFTYHDLMPGFHPALVRAAGFSGWTVPALRLDGRAVQGSREIMRALDAAVPDVSPLVVSPAVEEAEAWGERVLQDVPRRIFRWALVEDVSLRRWLLGDVAGRPAAGFLAVTGGLLPRVLAGVSRADEAAVRADIAGLDGLLDQVDSWMAEGLIGGEEANAADLQIFSSGRTLAAFADLRERLGERPCVVRARELIPDYPEIPRTLPAEWLA